MRFLKIGIVATGLLGASAFAGFANGYSEAPQSQVSHLLKVTYELDPIVTGNSVSSNQLENWAARKKRYDECGLCGKMQEFPGELPD